MGNVGHKSDRPGLSNHSLPVRQSHLGVQSLQPSQKVVSEEDLIFQKKKIFRNNLHFDELLGLFKFRKV